MTAISAIGLKTETPEAFRTRLVGREAELARLGAALDDAAAGRGGIVTLIGEAGLGKSRLVAELRARAGEIRWLEARCRQIDFGVSYSVFVDLLRDYFGWRADLPAAERGAAIADFLDEATRRGDLTREQAEEIGPPLGRLLAARFGNAWDHRFRHATPERVKHQTFLAVRDFLGCLARRGPMVLVFEDAHWADSLSLDLIALLMESLPETPHLLLCVYRPEPQARCWLLGALARQKCARCAIEVRLAPLSGGETRELAQELLPFDTLSPGVQQTIVERSRGNPLFMEEVVRTLVDAGLVYPDDRGLRGESARPAPARRRARPRPRPLGTRWRERPGIEAASLPENIQGAILSRVERLDRQLRSLLEWVSVIGHRAPRRLLAHGAPESADLDESLAELADRELLYQARTRPDEEYAFQHVLTQETVYDSILLRRRAALHQQVAEAIEALYEEGLEDYVEQLAHHYDRSERAEKAVEYLLKAGEKARRAYHNEEAIAYFSRALQRLGPDGRGGQPLSMLGSARREWRLATLRGLGQAHLWSGDGKEAEGYFRQATELGREIGLPALDLVRLYDCLGEAMFWQHRHAERCRIGEEGLALLGEERESVEAALMNSHVAAGAYYGNLDGDRWREFNLRNAALLEWVEYAEELRPAFAHLIQMCVRTDQDEEAAERWIEVLRKRGEEHHDLRAVAQAQDYRAVFILRARGDLRGSLELQTVAARLFREIGDSEHEGISLVSLGWGHLLLGELDDAESVAARVLDTAAGAGRMRALAYAYSLSGHVALCRGAVVKATDAFQKSARLLESIGARSDQALALLALGRCYLAHGERKRAVQQFQDAAVSGRGEPLLFAAALDGLEEAYADPVRYDAFCQRLRSGSSASEPLLQWRLTPAAPAERPALSAVDGGPGGGESGRWSWRDPFGDGEWSADGGVEIRAPNGRDLREINISAPRLGRSLSGDFLFQAGCRRARPERPAIGGLLLWSDSENYLRLDIGGRGERHVRFEGRIERQERVVGRGMIPAGGGEGSAQLRLERAGSLVTALCSADGENWLSLGSLDFHAPDPVEVGLHAVGSVDRAVYPAAHGEGTAIRFEGIQLRTEPPAPRR